MKYECDLIRDVVLLYKDGALSEKGAAAVEKHLSECESCRKYYDEFSDDAFCVPISDDVTEKAVNYGRKIAVYRSWQIGVFAVAVVALLTMVFPWFGYRGITEISGTTILRSPFALVGIVLFVFAVWYNFKSKHSRKICGYIGWGLWLFSDLYNFITIPMGSTVGVQWGPFNFEIPYFANFSLTNCFQNTLPGFYVGVLALFAVGVAFYFFVKKAAMDTV